MNDARDFTFMTMTSVGYGDITPTIAWGKWLSRNWRFGLLVRGSGCILSHLAQWTNQFSNHLHTYQSESNVNTLRISLQLCILSWLRSTYPSQRCFFVLWLFFGFTVNDAPCSRWGDIISYEEFRTRYVEKAAGKHQYSSRVFHQQAVEEAYSACCGAQDIFRAIPDYEAWTT